MIRGCTLNNTADHMCKVLAGLEEAKGRPIHDCSNCRHNLCNSSSKISHIYSILFIGTYLSLI